LHRGGRIAVLDGAEDTRHIGHVSEFTAREPACLWLRWQRLKRVGHIDRILR
jgi:hypothetical protein